MQTTFGRCGMWRKFDPSIYLWFEGRGKRLKKNWSDIVPKSRTGTHISMSIRERADPRRRVVNGARWLGLSPKPLR